ncbi:MAG: WYL domain-containing protein [Pseudomonadota bacterium]|nr:WYL domain-containing protein [Pseudomonadota bacterium]
MTFVVNQLIVQAIREKRRLRFTYNGVARLAEPQRYGQGKKGTELLRVHQLTGASQSKPLFDVSKMKNLAATDDFFARPGPNYKKNDSAMRVIFCQLKVDGDV